MNIVRQYRREIILTLVIKVIILSLLWNAFFRDKQNINPQQMNQQLLGNQQISTQQGGTDYD